MRNQVRWAGVAFVAVSLAAAGTIVRTPADATPGESPQRTRAEVAIAAAKAHPGVTRYGAGQEFEAVATIVDADGGSHVRLHRTYRGLEVLGGDLVVHRGKGGTWRGTSQTLRKGLTMTVTPSATAARLAGATKADARRLVVDATGATPRLAFEVLTSGVQHDGTPSRLATYLDARTGRTIRTEEQIQTVDGNGQSLYGGSVPLRLTQSGSTFQLRDPTRGNTYTTDMGNRTDSAFCTLLGIGCQAGTLFTSPDTSFGNGSTSSRESAAVDAQYGTNVTWDYFKNVFGRNGIFGNGTGSYNRVHYGTNYVNAFWDGTKMTYGDGDGTNYGPLTSLDVAGHEMTHGVTENTAGLTYSGESGGLNEATSDIFGTMVEFHAANAEDPGDYLIGEEFDLRNHAGLRRMDDPDSDGDSVNCWSSSTKNLDVHYSSGVGNHFFYLLAEGTGTRTFGGVTHTSTTCNGSSITGIGRDAAMRIWYRALTTYMTSSTNYAGARTATLNAARDLYGAGSVQYATVAAAWSGVNVA